MTDSNEPASRKKTLYVDFPVIFNTNVYTKQVENYLTKKEMNILKFRNMNGFATQTDLMRYKKYAKQPSVEQPCIDSSN